MMDRLLVSPPLPGMVLMEVKQEKADELLSSGQALRAIASPWPLPEPYDGDPFEPDPEADALRERLVTQMSTACLGF